MSQIYLDNNATTPLDPHVLELQRSLSKEVFGNPSSIHWAGRSAKRILRTARETIARLLSAEEDEIRFTSGGTESINTALIGVWESSRLLCPQKTKIISSPIEHQATLRTLEHLKSRGAEISYLSVDSKGKIFLDELYEKLQDNTLLVSLLYAHNELGNLYPVSEIGNLCREKGVLLHCDGVQAVGKISINLQQLPVDLFSFSAHKFHGPKGVGGLYVRKGLKPQSLHHGGTQEKNLRAGTENLIGIALMAKAMEIAFDGFSQKIEFICGLRDRMEKGLQSKLTGIYIQGDLEHRLANTTNLQIAGVDGESLLLNLDLEGVAASAGSACESGSIDPSHVLLAMGLSKEKAKASLRFSFSRMNTFQEVEESVERVVRSVQRLRK